MNVSVVVGLLQGKIGTTEEVPGECLEMNDRTDALAFVHQLEGLVDLFQAHGVGNELVQRYFTLLGLGDVARQFGSTLHATESGAAPNTTSDQLERTGADFCTCRCHADNGGLPQPLWQHSRAARISWTFPMHSKE